MPLIPDTIKTTLGTDNFFKTNSILLYHYCNSKYLYLIIVGNFKLIFKMLQVEHILNPKKS